MASTTYEVQVLQAGKWRIHAQFPANARDDALDEAKMLEAMPGIAGIKVIRDSYDDRTGLHNEHVIHKHVPKQPAQLSSGDKYAHYMARASANRAAAIKDPFEGTYDDGPPAKSSSFIGVIVKFLLILLFSIGISAALTMFLNVTLPYQKIGGIALYGQMRANIMMVTALVVFLIALGTMIKLFMGRDELSKIELERQQKEAERRRREQARKKAEANKKAREKEQKKRKKEEEEELKRKAEEALKRKAEEAEKEKAEQEGEAEDQDAKAEEETPAEEEAEEEEEHSNLSPLAQQQKQVLLNFFGEAVRHLPAERKKMDNYNRFGVNLYLAGATEALGGERNLDMESVTIILSDALQMMGLKPEHAEAFARRYEDYLLQDARYMEMFQSGRNALSQHLNGDPESAKGLDQALHEWNKPKAPEDPEKEVVVMFTDIVGSTQLTHERGNLAAQEVVRAHNRIVRDALAGTGGKEIKHTGDGIMASFVSVTKSLVATRQMQSMIQLHNQQTPDVPLKVKIGINAGRVVMEEQDLYGVTVQMAARIVDKAQADQIFISETVHGMAKGGDWQFVRRGPYYLKGIDGPAYLYEFVWDDKADLEAVKAQARAETPALEQAYAQASGQPAPQSATPGATPGETPGETQNGPTQTGPTQTSQGDATPTQGAAAQTAQTPTPSPQPQAPQSPGQTTEQTPGAPSGAPKTAPPSSGGAA